MYRQKRLSNVTKAYLCCFYKILEIMIEGMTRAELTDSISHNFIVQMIPHHMAAIEMSQNILQYTTFIPLQEIALNIINEQTKSIENMHNVLTNCGKFENSHEDLSTYQKHFTHIIQTMFKQMQNARITNNINKNFMREMIPHHKGAIRMSKNALQYNICTNLVPILNSIIKTQQEGVHKMEMLLYR